MSDELNLSERAEHFADVRTADIAGSDNLRGLVHNALQLGWLAGFDAGSTEMAERIQKMIRAAS